MVPPGINWPEVITSFASMKASLERRMSENENWSVNDIVTWFNMVRNFYILQSEIYRLCDVTDLVNYEIIKTYAADMLQTMVDIIDRQIELLH
ncbi:unnamed protein product [Caenorhabditis bovis]|uniref:Uncharacterized protein n=1 Tax=Caenorhabditis bovis TaxID=2654633 RepID=A0A8S1FEJ0_9PELO|nr:unnamed protein product [Caenorhabditis bovis]